MAKHCADVQQYTAKVGSIRPLSASMGDVTIAELSSPEGYHVARVTLDFLNRTTSICPNSQTLFDNAVTVEVARRFIVDAKRLYLVLTKLLRNCLLSVDQGSGSFSG